MIRTRIFLLLLSALLISLGLAMGASYQRRAASHGFGVAGQTLAGQLNLTDLSLWTEARYTRHPSQADSFAAFQDHPAALEHFPAGSIVAASPPQQGQSIQVRKKSIKQ